MPLSPLSLQGLAKCGVPMPLAREMIMEAHPVKSGVEKRVPLKLSSGPSEFVKEKVGSETLLALLWHLLTSLLK